MDFIFTGTNNWQPLRATHPLRNTAVQTAQAWRRAETGDHSWWKGLVDASDRCFRNFSKVVCSYWQLPPKIVERLRTGSMFCYEILGLNRSIFFMVSICFYRPRTSGFPMPNKLDEITDQDSLSPSWNGCPWFVHHHFHRTTRVKIHIIVTYVYHFHCISYYIIV